MKILISNDDGYQAPGIVALHDALHTIADVEVVAPENNKITPPRNVEIAINGGTIPERKTSAILK